MPGRRGAAALAAAALASMTIGIGSALGVALWTLTMTPLTATVGVTTTFQFTATSLDVLLGIKCVVVQVPNAVNAGEVWITGSSTDADWATSRSGQTVTVAIASGDGDAKLRAGDWVSFAVNGTPTQAGTYAFPGVAYSNHGCSEDPRQLAVPPSVVISGPVQLIVEPTPTPTPTPVSAPTPTPTPLLELPVLPPLLPTATPSPTPSANPTPRPIVVAPSLPPPSETPAATPSSAMPSPTASPLANGAAAASPTASVPPSATAGGGTGPVLAVGRADPGGPDAFEISLGPMGVIDGLGVWAIPSAVISGPGLLVIVWVVIQASVAAAWVPAVKRLRGAGPRMWQDRSTAAR